MKTQFIFSAIVFSSVTLFSSVSFGKTNSSEAPSGLCKFYMNEVKEENHIGFAFITAKGSNITDTGKKIPSSNDQLIVTTAHLSFDKRHLIDLKDGRKETISQFKNMHAVCNDVTLKLKFEASLSRVGLPGFPNHERCHNRADTIGIGLIPKGCDMGIFSITSKLSNSDAKKLNRMGYDATTALTDEAELSTALIDTTLKEGHKLNCKLYKDYTRYLILKCPNVVGGKIYETSDALSKIGIASGTPVLAANTENQPLVLENHIIAFATVTSIDEFVNGGGFFIYADKIIPTVVNPRSNSTVTAKQTTYLTQMTLKAR